MPSATTHIEGVSAERPAPWYRALDRRQWFTLAAANLGWLFDGYESYALLLTMGVAFRQILPASSYPAIPFYAGLTLAVTLLGWGLGGIVGGIVADYVGRKRTMIYAILAYSVLTGFTALAWSWLSYVLLRFVVGLALGSEWGTGTAMMAELWPGKHRGKGAGLMQCGLGVGFFVASAVWYFVNRLGPSAWRWMFVIGVLPAIATLWIRRGIVEPERWSDSNALRQKAMAATRRGQQLDAKSEHYARFTLVDLFSDTRTRRITIAALLMSCTTTITWWGISGWVPSFVGSLALKQGLSEGQWASFAGMAYNIGAIAGYIGFGFCADAWGRKPVTLAWFVISWLLTPVLFLWTHQLYLILVVCGLNAVFTLGQYTWCSTWLPEAYPTRMRATAVAFVFNAPRFLACFGPLAAGTLIAYFGGYGKAALIVSTMYAVGICALPFFPETIGKPLPE
ncbi:MAG TPA: MFS transporter [Candidatus Acidoferrales bacterium]|jgi:MFS family permease|nr:MFS transporter [Candidatus Acidoferrales bacterium]